MSASVDREPPIPTGPIGAVLLSIFIGMLTLLLAHQGSTQSKTVENHVYSLGKWIPGAVGAGPGGSIGPYSGKEVLAVTAWLASWAVLHLIWRKKSFAIEAWVGRFLVGVTVVSVLFIHPIADPIFGLIAKAFGL